MAPAVRRPTTSVMVVTILSALARSVSTTLKSTPLKSTLFNWVLVTPVTVTVLSASFSSLPARTAVKVPVSLAVALSLAAMVRMPRGRAWSPAPRLSGTITSAVRMPPLRAATTEMRSSVVLAASGPRVTAMASSALSVMVVDAAMP